MVITCRNIFACLFLMLLVGNVSPTGDVPEDKTSSSSAVQSATLRTYSADDTTASQNDSSSGMEQTSGNDVFNTNKQQTTDSEDDDILSLKNKILKDHLDSRNEKAVNSKDEYLEGIRTREETERHNVELMISLVGIAAGIVCAVTIVVVVFSIRRRKTSLSRKISLNREAKRLDLRVLRKETNSVNQTLSGIPTVSDIWREMHANSSSVI